MDHHHAAPQQHPTGDGPGYEISDANPRSLLAFGGIVSVFLAIVLVSMLWVYKFFVDEKAPNMADSLPKVAPNLEIYDVLHALRESEKERLTTYGWVDRKAGIVRIPIDRAIDLVVERGVPKGKGPRSAAELNGHSGIKAEEADSQPKATDTKPAPESTPAPAAKAQEKDVKK